MRKFWIFDFGRLKLFKFPLHRERARVRANLYKMDAKVPMLRDRARQLRRNQTDVEGKLWSRLRGAALTGTLWCQVRRQYPIGAFIVDFCCYERRLVIELDGGHHAQHMDADQSRTDFFVSQGYRVLRFWNNEVEENMTEYWNKLRTPSPCPSPRGRGLGKRVKRYGQENNTRCR